MMNWTLSQADSATHIVAADDSRLRIQLLSRAVIRVELARTDGTFCDDPTFTVIGRPRAANRPGGGDHAAEASADMRTPDANHVRISRGGRTHDYTVIASRDGFTIALPTDAAGAAELVTRLVVLANGEPVYEAWNDPGLIAKPPQPDTLPPPHDREQIARGVWVLHDRPRAIPPARGSLPPSRDDNLEQNDWAIESEFIDLYFVLHGGDLTLLREEVMELTGRPPLPPRWTFGFWHSRYYPYNEESALELMDEYDRREIPLDVFVMDTDWREGASRGYKIDAGHFPDMARFLGACAERGIKTVFNDHPEPRGLEPLDPELFRYRQENLTRLMDMGLDGWWFDRNWGEIIPGPVAGVETAIWGQKLYHDIMQAHRPGKRVALLSMVAPHIASHRYPLHWTGDIRSDWNTLAMGVRDSVEQGYQLCAYAAQDIGGHCGFPTPEQYVRWIQWGAVSPTMRIHAGPRNRFREPWRFGSEAGGIAEAYIRFRYRLLALIYSLAFENHRTGLPMLRGMELAEPEPPAWTRNTQFMLGGNLLIAPVTRSSALPPEDGKPYYFAERLRRRVWRSSEGTAGGSRGNEVPQRSADEVAFEHTIRMDAINSSEAQMRWGNGFYVVWEGTFRSETPGWYLFRLRGNGSKGLAIDGTDFPQLLRLFDGGSQEAALWLESGDHHLICTYEHAPSSIPEVILSISPVEEADAESVLYELWVPPGRWRDLWSGVVYEGPTTVRASSALHQLPAFVRLGSLVPVAPVQSRTAPLDRIACELFVDSEGFTCSTQIYDDDGETNDYLEGSYRLYELGARRDGDLVAVRIRTARNDGARDEGSHGERELPLTLRVHLLPDERVAAVEASTGVESAADTRTDGGTTEDGMTKTPAAVPAEAQLSWQELPVASAEQRITPLALSDEIAQFTEGESVLVTAPPGVRELRIRLAQGARESSTPRG